MKPTAAELLHMKDRLARLRQRVDSGELTQVEGQGQATAILREMLGKTPEQTQEAH